jgi:O-antigen ligase
MAYLLCLVYIAIIYIRPAELNHALIPYHIAETTGIVAAAAAIFSVLLKPRPVLNLPQDWCFLGFCVVALIANPTAGSLVHLTKVLETVIPLMGFYFLIRVTVQTKRQLYALVVVLIALTLFQAANPIFQLSSPERADYSAPSSGADQPSGLTGVQRLQGTGIYGDPNDLAMSLLVVLPFLFSAILSPSSGVLLRLAGLGTLGTIGYALLLTQSRGGFLGVAALTAGYAYRRFGKAAAVGALVAVVAAGLATGPSRFQEIDAREASAQGRVEAWSAGLQMLKAHPLLGVGYGRFTQYHDRVAHNAFVHAFAEMGVVGGFCLVGLFSWHFIGTGARRNVAGAATSSLARDLWASALGIVVTASFLSQQNMPVLYIPLALGATRIAIEGRGIDSQVSPALGWAVAGVWAGLTVVGTYVGVRLLGAWG